MTNFIYQTKLNFTRIILRNKKFFFFDLALPIIFYLLYTKVLVTNAPTAAIKQFQLSYLVSMIIFSCLLGSIITVANNLLEDQTSKFELFVDISPLPKPKYYASLIVVFLSLNLISVIVISLVGIFVNHVDISLAKLVLVSISSLLGTIPLILIGIVISMFKTPSTVNMLTSLTVFPMAMISGLWWPLATEPTWLQNIGKLLPTYAIANINNSIISNSSINIVNIFNILIWLAILLITIDIINKLPTHKELQAG